MREADDSSPAPSEGPQDHQLAYDWELLHRVQSGDPRKSGPAMEELLLYCQSSIAHYIGRNVAGYDNQQEAIQLTCMYVLQNVADFRFRDVPLSHWFMRVAAYKVRDQRRAAARDRQRHCDERTLADQPPDEMPDDLSRHECDRLVHIALKRLPEVEQQILILIYFRGLTNATAIGDLLGLHPATVRQHHRRALQKLERIPDLRRLFDDLSLY